jgi:hypothetical protein
VRGLSPSNDLIDTYRNITKIPFSINQSHNIFASSMQPDLSYGSLYNDNFERLDLTPAHRSRYFQISNRCDNEMCGIKVVSHGSCNVYQEVFRPPYYAIPPYESAFSLMPEEAPFVYVFVLFDNHVLCEEGDSIVFKAVSADRISPCAKVSNFRRFAIYKLKSRGCNVLLKYKPNGKLELRDGEGRRLVNKVAGFFSTVLRTSSSSSMPPENTDGEIEAATLDLTTNADSIEEVMYM